MNKMKILCLTMLVSFLMPVMVLAETPPAIPLAVYGDMKIDSANAPIGTVVTVFNGTTEVARMTTTQVGKYFLEVPASNKGSNLTYKVNGTVAIQKVAANPASVASDKIDLAVNITVPVVSAPAASNGGGTTSSNTTPTTTTIPTPTPDTTPTNPTLPPTPPTITPQVLGVKISAAEVQLNQILTDSAAIWTENIDTILNNAGGSRNQNSEKTISDKYLSNLTHNEKNFLSADANRLDWFITYGTVGTKILGVGERAGVLNSYKAAFGKLPKTESQWQDAIKIANGRWPSVKNAMAETKAKASFKKIYAREAKMDNANDNAAVTVMAYGLRPSARNLNSEKAAILAFKYFIKRAPVSAVDWDMVRAIAYSGAKR